MKEKDYSKSIEVFSGSPWEAEITEEEYEAATELIRARDEKDSD